MNSGVFCYRYSNQSFAALSKIFARHGNNKRLRLDKSLFKSQIFFPRMMADMEAVLLAKAEAAPNFRKLVIGLAEEAAARRII